MPNDPSNTGWQFAARASRADYYRATRGWGGFAEPLVAARRLQDLNVPGVWAVVLVAWLPLLLLSFATGGPIHVIVTVLAAVAMGSAIVMKLLLLALPGTKGPNRYGPEANDQATSPRPYVPPAPVVTAPSTGDLLTAARHELDAAKRRLTPPA